MTVWGRNAETASEYLTKGSPVLIEGRLKLDTWEKDGQKHSKLKVVCERCYVWSAAAAERVVRAANGRKVVRGRPNAVAAAVHNTISPVRRTYADDVPPPEMSGGGGGGEGGGDDIPF